MKRITDMLPAAVSTLMLLGMAVFALPWVRDSSGSLALDFALIFAWATLAMAAGWFQVALVVPPGGAPERDLAAGPGGAWSGFTASALFRTGLVFAAVLANLFWSNAAADNFWFGYYARIGTYSTGLRSPDPKDRRWAIGRIAEMAREPVTDLVRPLARLMDDDDESVRADAVAALAHLTRRMRIAVSTLGQGNEAGRWEPGLLARLRKLLGDPAARVLEARGPVRRAWIFAVGGMGDASAIPILESVLEGPESTTDDKVAAVDALVDIMDPACLPVLEKALTSPEVRVAVHSAWAIGQVLRGMIGADPLKADKDHEYRSVVSLMTRVLPSLDGQAVCAFLKLFPDIADARFTGALIRLSSSRALPVRCKRLERTVWFGAPEPIVPDGRVSDLVLNAMASVALGNRKLRTF
ncbi:MAG: hypothetical protein GXP54_01415, partial [Deltaproteobacteria bacterium]|nr:hypothetical protein [Deltaproteobacteria bacterium]